MGNPVNAWRRWFGALFLIAAAGMLIWGQTVLKSHLHGWAFVYYWTGCFVFTGLAMLMALLDVRALQRQARDEHRTLLKTALKGVDAESEEKRREENSNADKSRG